MDRIPALPAGAIHCKLEKLSHTAHTFAIDKKHDLQKHVPNKSQCQLKNQLCLRNELNRLSRTKSPSPFDQNNEADLRTLTFPKPDIAYETNLDDEEPGKPKTLLPEEMNDLNDDIDTFKVKLSKYLIWYNHKRPHSALKYVSPMQFIQNSIPKSV